jgi:hypothetical protein
MQLKPCRSDKLTANQYYTIMSSDNYTLEELFDYKNFSSGFLRKVEECIEVNKSMKILFCDIDGTLTETISGHAFKHWIKDDKMSEKSVAGWRR